MNFARSVLIVETDPDVRSMLTLILTEAGYAVAGFATGAAALAAVQAGQPAAILITEVHLPVLDGWHLARAVRRLRPGLPILYIPARYDDRSQQVSRSFVLPKPFQARALTVAVRLMACPPETYH